MDLPGPLGKIARKLRQPSVHRSRYYLHKVATVAIYVILSGLSVLWAVSERSGPENELGAVVGIGRTNEGTAFITLRNEGRDDWTDVIVDIDGRYFLAHDRVPAGGSVDARMRDFRSRYALPRATGIFAWESIAGDREPESRADPRYSPAEVSIECAEGSFRRPLDGT